MIRLDEPFKDETDALKFCALYETAEVRTRLEALGADGSLTDKQRKKQKKEIQAQSEQHVEWLNWLNQDPLLRTRRPLLAMALGLLAFDSEEREAFTEALLKMNRRCDEAAKQEEDEE